MGSVSLPDSDVSIPRKSLESVFSPDSEGFELESDFAPDDVSGSVITVLLKAESLSTELVSEVSCF